MKLNAQQRAEIVMSSQGWAIGRLPSFPAEVRAKLAELCAEDGTLDKDTRDKFKAIKDEHFDSLKAAVDEPAGDKE